MNKAYLRLNSDGTLEHVYEECSPRSLTDTIIKEFGSKTSRVSRNVFTVDSQPAGLIISDTETYAYMGLSALHIRTVFQAGDDKILRPLFSREEDVASDLLLDALWTPPANMRLVFSAKIYEPNSNSPLTMPQKSCYLMALDPEHRVWRLPLPNLYDPCDLCMGHFEGAGRSVHHAFTRAYDQLKISRWNTDLLSGKEGAARELFKFKMTNAGMVMAPYPLGFNWQSYCFKSANQITMMVSEALK